MRKTHHSGYAVFLLAFAASLPAGQATARDMTTPPTVVASIQPVHSLVAGVMSGAGEPLLLLKGGLSPHGYALRPSDARRLNKADIVFWIGDTMETFLAKPLKALGPEKMVVGLLGTQGLPLIPLRDGSNAAHPWHEGENRDSGERDPVADRSREHDLRAVNPHIWLDPEIATLLVRAIAEALGGFDPARKRTYATNAARLAARLQSLDLELRELTGPVRGKSYVLFHDAFPYFERRYGLVSAGAFTLAPDRAPGGRRLRELRERILATGAHCAFREPQFPPALLSMLAGDMNLEVAELDPMGTGLDPGPDAYFAMMQRLGLGFRRCLDPSFAGTE